MLTIIYTVTKIKELHFNCYPMFADAQTMVLYIIIYNTARGRGAASPDGTSYLVIMTLLSGNEHYQNFIEILLIIF